LRPRVALPIVALAFAVLGVSCRGCLSRPPRTNVLLVTFDTTRADHLGCYGFQDAQTPVVDRLAREGVLFESAYSSIPLTAPSHATILTGRYPIAHGVRDNGLFVLSPEQETLAEILKQHGYATAAAIGGFPLVARFGLDQGFGFYDDRLVTEYDMVLGTKPTKPPLAFDERRAARVNEAAIGWLQEHAQQPFFLWVHYYDPHQPFQPPVPYDDLFAASPYDGEIAYADESLGTLLDSLRSLEVYDRTLVVLTADHGEGLGDHGELTHSYLLYDSTLRVPLVMRGPGLPAGHRAPGRVRLVDVAPTILDALGLGVPAGMQGRSLTALWSGTPARVDRTHYAETLSPRLSQNWGELRALFDERWKYVHGPRPELFDLGADPGELRNLASENPAQAAAMKGRLAEFLERHSPPGGSRLSPVDDETRSRLQALGYLAAGAGQDQEIREVLRDDGIAPQDRAGDVSQMATARSLLAEHQPLPAREIASQLLVNAPDDPYYLELYATAEVMLDRPDAALQAVERMLKGPNPGTADRLLVSIGRSRFGRGDREPGLALVRRGVELKPTAAGYHELASLQAAAGRSQDERASLEAALALDARYAPARVDRAVRLAQAGQRDEARREMEAALADRPYYAKGHYNLGALLVEAGDLGGAVARFDRAVQIEPEYERARYAAIAVRVRLGRGAEAEKALGEWEAQVPGSAEAVKARALLKVKP
jgi:arylsulfatase A-like enzyme